MANFVFLYTGGGMPATDAERNRVTQEWTQWFSKLGSAVIDQGNPFSPGGKSLTHDGRVLETTACTAASGYSVIRAETLKAALDLAKGCPQLKSGGDISVFETFPVM
jgi:hypothetical protein